MGAALPDGAQAGEQPFINGPPTETRRLGDRGPVAGGDPPPAPGAHRDCLDVEQGSELSGAGPQGDHVGEALGRRERR